MRTAVGWDKLAASAGPPRHRSGRPARAALAGSTLLLLFALLSPAYSAPPKVTALFPAGGQRGQTVEVTASGDFSTWPVQVWADRPGLTATAEKDKGKLKVEIAAEAAAGTYWLRLCNADGASVLRPFIVGTLVEVLESETNDLPDKPQTVEPRVVVNGKLAKSGDVDGYRLELKQGQTLVASLVANSTLGAPMDAALQICELVDKASARREPLDNTRVSAADNQREAGASRSPGKAEAFVVAQNHDSAGLDPLLAFTAPRDGAYLVRLFALPAQPDSSVRFAGGDDYLYRLTLTTGPYIDHALPLAAANAETQVQFGGWNLGEVRSTIVPPLSAEPDPLPDGGLAWAWHPSAAGAFPLPRLANTIGGRLEGPGAIHTHSFPGSKGQKVRLRAAAKSLGFPTDPVIAVLDSAGKVLAEADDSGRDERDATLEFTPEADGTYQVQIRDLARRGDVRMAYRLTIEPVQPDFSLSLAADSFVLEKDKPLEIPVTVAARDGFRDAVEVRAVGLPAGITAEPVKFEPTGDAPMSKSGGGRRGKSKGGTAPSGPTAKLILKADPATAQAGGFAFRIEGRTSGDSPLIRTARFPLNLPLAGQHHAAWLTVK